MGQGPEPRRDDARAVLGKVAEELGHEAKEVGGEDEGEHAAEGVNIADAHLHGYGQDHDAGGEGVLHKAQEPGARRVAHKALSSLEEPGQHEEAHDEEAEVQAPCVKVPHEGDAPLLVIESVHFAVVGVLQALEDGHVVALGGGVGDQDQPGVFLEGVEAVHEGRIVLVLGVEARNQGGHDNGLDKVQGGGAVVERLQRDRHTLPVE